MNWRAVQKRIGAGVDGDLGRETFGRLMATAAQRAYGPVHTRMGEAVARYAGQFKLLDGQCDRLVALICETCHETTRYTRWEESLSYSAQRASEVWPGRYRGPNGKPNDRARAVANNPRALAIDTYGGRMGNRPDTNDGWDMRGRGPTMLTGLDNYRAMAALTGLDLVTHPELAADPYSGMLIAMWFYEQRGVFTAPDDETERRRVNGGLIGFAEVQAIRRRVRAALDG